MKLGVISDPHGDVAALARACEHLDALGAERIVCAGDLVGYGPEPDRVVGFVVERRIPTARGNHDRWALSRAPGAGDEFGGAPVGEVARAFLGGLPPYVLLADGPRVIVVVHGSPLGDMHYVTRGTHPPAVLRGFLETLNADLLIVGHTHEPMAYACAAGMVVNPGSLVTVGRVRSSRSFALVDTERGEAAFFDVETGDPIPVRPWVEADGAWVMNDNGPDR